MDKDHIRVEVSVNANIKDVWLLWSKPEHICKWNNASDEWETTKAINHLWVGGTFSYYMTAKDKSAGFDFNGIYTTVDLHKFIKYTIEDGRTVSVSFESLGNQTKIIELFEPETDNTHELQQSGWQAILDNFKRYAEAN
jgi:uncharacterized protein YndB with AHSA1/START domain